MIRFLGCGGSAFGGQPEVGLSIARRRGLSFYGL